MVKKSLLIMMLLAVFAPWAANAQTTLPWSENFEDYASTDLGSEWATPAMYGGKPCVLTNNGWASPAGQYSLECSTNNSNPIVFVFPQFDKNLNWLNVQFKISGHADGRGEFGYVTNANNASTFTKLTDISPQPAVVGNNPGYTSYNYDLSTMNAPHNSSYRLAVRYTFVGSGEDSWYFDDFSVTYTEPSGGDSSGELTVYDKTTFFYTLDGNREDDGNCEDFESVEGVNAANGAGYMPEGWNYIYTGSNIGYRPKVYNGDSYKPSGLFATDIGNNILMMIAGNSSGYGENTYVILPPYENVTGISFNAWRESASKGTLYFGYITNANDASTFHQLEQLATVYYRDANTTNASFEYNDLSIPSGARLAFRWNYNSSWYSAFIDNVCVKVDAETAFTKEITAHSGTAGWHLIASPLAETITDLTTVENLINAETPNNYDLYRFNQAPTMNSNEEYLEWENYKSHTEEFLIKQRKTFTSTLMMSM